MSEQKKIDAERAAFDAWFNDFSLSVRMNGGYMNDAQMFAAWQARTSLPVGLPDGYALVPVEPSFETRQALYNSGFEAPDNILDYGYRSILGAVKVPVEAYRADTRKPHELSAAGCRCVRFGEGNPHWPCELHAAKKEHADLVAVWRCRIAGSESYAYFPSKRCRFCEPLYAAPQPGPDVRGLAAFALELIDGAWEGGSFDGSDIQEAGVRHGLLTVEQRQESCGEHCNCAEYGFPAECYRMTPALATHRQAKP